MEILSFQINFKMIKLLMHNRFMALFIKSLTVQLLIQRPIRTHKQKMQKQHRETPNAVTPKPLKQDYSFLTKLPTLFTISGNPFTILQVIGAGGTEGSKYVRKSIILNEDNIKYAYNQRTMMQIINSDYVLKLLHWEQVKLTKSKGSNRQLAQSVQQPIRLALYMNFCEKGDLRNYLQQENPSIAKRVEIFIDILYAMRFLHEKFIIHRDMKLENIFVGEDDKIKIADLGYAAQTASLADSKLGTFAYQAPEVYVMKQGEGGYSDKADVWSVGYLGFQVLNKPLPEQVKQGKLIRDPFMPSEVLRKKVTGITGSLKDEYPRIFEQNPLMFVSQIPNSLKYLIGDMLVPYPEKRIGFREIYEGKYLHNLRKELLESKEFGVEGVEKMQNLQTMIDDYPKIYQGLKGKQKRMQKHEQLHKYLQYRLYYPLSKVIYPEDILRPIVGQQANSMNILLFITMRKLRLIYEQVTGEDLFALKKKMQECDKAISGKYLQVKNSVDAYLRSQGEKGVDENELLNSEQYFIKLMKQHAKAIKVNAQSMIV